MNKVQYILVIVCLLGLTACHRGEHQQEVEILPSRVAGEADSNTEVLSGDTAVVENLGKNAVTAMEFSSSSWTPSPWFISNLHHLDKTNTLPLNREHQLLPSWLRVGENSLKEVLTELKELTPIIYISEEEWALDPDNHNLFADILPNPDIPMSNRAVLPTSYPLGLTLYAHNFIELNRLTREVRIPETPEGFEMGHWYPAYSRNQPIIYEYIATLAGVSGRVRLEFHGDHLHSVIFIPELHQRIDISHQELPILPNVNFSGEQTLGDLFDAYGLTGTIKIVRWGNRLEVHYQQEVLWNEIPLTVNYDTSYGQYTTYTTLEKAPIFGITIFNFTDLGKENEFLALLKERHPLSEEQKEWLYAFYRDAFGKYVYYDKEAVSAPFNIIDDHYMLFHQGFSLTREHIIVTTKDNFDFGPLALNFQ
ncbi:hypothetical protein PVA45_02945 [Entomospira entomophila]|uniref:Lipoprotein n=1 Tax=Entomospira entomophila TaxID=2719988 RepID=A0A968KSM1_9SPIO|nr:hypothetical protein [Entomospira entomophilus]NIZ40472.1 hypothetical protein [Entomospira entomophilus]WDI36030.1 hypothetical protein PVA45_02945 [Entomospira entomophilus]